MTMNSVVVLVVAKTKAKTLASLYLVVVAVGDGAMARWRVLVHKNILLVLQTTQLVLG